MRIQARVAVRGHCQDCQTKATDEQPLFSGAVYTTADMIVPAENAAQRFIQEGLFKIFCPNHKHANHGQGSGKTSSRRSVRSQ